jgi:6-phosphogluconolactonase (cycloisomerase 2 family)
MNRMIGAFPCGGLTATMSRGRSGFRFQCMDIVRRMAIFALMAIICYGCVPRFAYVVDSEDDSVSVYAIDAGTGRLRSLGYHPTGSRPSGIAFQLDGKFAFVTNQGTGGSGSVSAFAVDSARGSLKRLDADPVTPGIQDFPTGPAPRALAMHGAFLYVANYGFVPGALGSVSGFAVDAATGMLTSVPAPAATAGVNPTGIVSDGTHVYVLNSGGPGLLGRRPGVSAFSVAANGALTRIDANPSTAVIEDFQTTLSPAAVALRSDGKALLVANGGLATISVYDIDAASGALTRVDADTVSPGIQDFATGSNPWSLASANGFTYVANGAFGISNGTLATFQTSAGGLTHVDANPSTPAGDDLPLGMPPPAVGVATTTWDCGLFGVCSRNDFVYATSAGAHEIRTFSTDDFTTGAMSAKPAAPPVVGRRGPIAVATLGGSAAVSIRTRRAFVAHRGLSAEGVVWSYDIDPATGALTPINTAHIGAEGVFAGRPSSLAATADGRFVFSGRSVTSGVGGYTVDPVTGALGVASGSPTAVGGFDGIPPHAIAIDPSQRFVYFATLDTVYGFTIDASSGALAPHTAANFACWSGQGIPIVIHPSGRFLYCGAATFVAAIDRSTGMLSNMGSFAPSNYRLSGGAIDPSGRFYYAPGEIVSAATGSLGILAFEIDSNTGTGRPIDANPATPAVEAYAVPGAPGKVIIVDPLGRFVFAAGGNSSIAVYGIDPLSGRLTPIDADPSTANVDAFATDPFWSFNVEPGGRFLYVPNHVVDGTIDVFSIDSASGMLSPVDADPGKAGIQGYPSSFNPAAITFWSEIQ